MAAGVRGAEVLVFELSTLYRKLRRYESETCAVEGARTRVVPVTYLLRRGGVGECRAGVGQRPRDARNSFISGGFSVISAENNF